MEPAAGSVQSASFFMTLPTDLISMIYNSLEVKDIVRQNLVCTRARNIATDLLIQRFDKPSAPVEDTTQAIDRLTIKASLQSSKLKRKSPIDLRDLFALQFTVNELNEAKQRLKNESSQILSMARGISA